MISWGDPEFGGELRGETTKVSRLESTQGAFAALLEDGQAGRFAWISGPKRSKGMQTVAGYDVGPCRLWRLCSACLWARDPGGLLGSLCGHQDGPAQWILGSIWVDLGLFEPFGGAF